MNQLNNLWYTPIRNMSSKCFHMSDRFRNPKNRIYFNIWKLDSFDEMTCFNKQKSWIYSISDTISCSASGYLITLDFFLNKDLFHWISIPLHLENFHTNFSQYVPFYNLGKSVYRGGSRDFEKKGRSMSANLWLADEENFRFQMV